MKLLDTCVWIKIILGGPLDAQFNVLALDKPNVLVAGLVQFELRCWALREYAKSRANDIILALREAVVVPTDERVALLAAELARVHKRQAMDALIYATVLLHDAQLVTCNAHFKGLPSVDCTPTSK